MTTVTQRAVPVQAARLAKEGDARALLAIPDARLDIPRLIDGRRFEAAWTGFYRTSAATDFAGRKAIAAAKAIVAERAARREARVVAEAARQGTPGRIVAMVEAKRAAAARKRQEAAARRERKIQEKTKEAFRPSYHAADFRTAAQGSTWTIKFATQGSSTSIKDGDPSIVSHTEEGWIDYKRAGWRRGIKSQKITVTIPLRWDTRVGDRGLGLVDGLLTLDAEPIKGAPEGIELFRATWARQGRGTLIVNEIGVIARHTASGATYHAEIVRSGYSSGYVDGKTVDYEAAKRMAESRDKAAAAKAAVAGLKRKLTAQGVPADVRHARAQAASLKRAANRAAQIVRLVERVAAWDLGEIGHVVVRREHSIKAGNCEPGTDAFIDRFFPERGHDSEATIGELAGRIGRADLAALAANDLTLARQLAAACLVAIRKDKQARRSLDAV